MTQTKALRLRESWLLAATFLVAVAGLIYELVAATLSSYLLGDSVRQFSLVIGVFLSSMGVGSWLSRYVGQAFSGFVWAQILLGLIGGFMAPVLFFAYGWMDQVGLPLYAMLIAVGVLSGMEIPLIARVLKEEGAGEFRFENVLSVDYIGALAASLAFPLFIVPQLGLMSASLAFGCLNLAVAGLSLYIFRDRASRAQITACALAFAATGMALIASERLVSASDAALYQDDIILSEATPYQQITVTSYRGRTRLFLDHSIQFDSADEYRYHEMLVHPAMSLAPRAQSVLILGGGDGMAAREVLRHEGVTSLTLVDLDPRVTELFRDHPTLAPLNDHALSDPRVEIINTDAWEFIETSDQSFDIILLDLPDPRNLALSRLYSVQFYSLLVERLSTHGLLATQSGSPLFARQAFWCISETLQTARNPAHPSQGLNTLPYHAYLPSFGEWGFTLASQSPIPATLRPLPETLRFLSAELWHAAQIFPPDMSALPAEPNTLHSHALVTYYLDGWEEWFR